MCSMCCFSVWYLGSAACTAQAIWQPLFVRSGLQRAPLNFLWFRAAFSPVLCCKWRPYRQRRLWPKVPRSGPVGL